jgi:hypothetical protein
MNCSGGQAHNDQTPALDVPGQVNRSKMIHAAVSEGEACDVETVGMEIRQWGDDGNGPLFAASFAAVNGETNGRVEVGDVESASDFGGGAFPPEMADVEVGLPNDAVDEDVFSGENDGAALVERHKFGVGEAGDETEDAVIVEPHLFTLEGTGVGNESLLAVVLTRANFCRKIRGLDDLDHGDFFSLDGLLGDVVRQDSTLQKLQPGFFFFHVELLGGVDNDEGELDGGFFFNVCSGLIHDVLGPFFFWALEEVGSLDPKFEAILELLSVTATGDQIGRILIGGHVTEFDAETGKGR